MKLDEPKKLNKKARKEIKEKMEKEEKKLQRKEVEVLFNEEFDGGKYPLR